MEKKPIKYSVVNAFTDTPFKGNPAAVCLLEEEKSGEWLQAVVKEFNVPLTCYLTRIMTTTSSPDHPDQYSKNIDQDYLFKSTITPPPRFNLRWFSPTVEVKLCGHATLAASHFLFTSGLVSANKIEFLTLSGVLTAKRVFPEAKETDSLNMNINEEEAAQDCFSIELDFPLVPLVESDSAMEFPSVSKALNGASVIELKKTALEDHLAVLPSAKAVLNLQPQFDEIKQCAGRGIIVTGLAAPGSEFDFFSRFLYPKLGINEDHVCGSAHCALVDYWSKKLGKNDFVAYSASPRGGIINIHLDEKSQRVLLRGKAVTVMEGCLLV